jgi:hypothetical protein
MLQAHTFLWHYLWVAPNLLLLSLALILWKRGTARQFPAFFAFAVLGAIGQLSVYAADVLPFVSGETFWRIDCADLMLEAVLKFVLIAEIFALLFGSYASVARLGRLLIRALGVILIFTAAVAAAYAPKLVAIINGANLIGQTIYIVESGVLAFIFLFSFYFRLSWPRQLFGIALGLSVSACIHLATWALISNAGLPYSSRLISVFLNMGAYHICVLIWFYYLLVPQKAATKSSVLLPENNLDVWNRELERLLQQ